MQMVQQIANWQADYASRRRPLSELQASWGEMHFQNSGTRWSTEFQPDHYYYITINTDYDNPPPP